VHYVSSILAAAAAAVAFTAPASAAAPAQQSTGRALLLVPLTLVKIDDLDFGSVVPSASLGVVTINASSGARTLVGGVTGVPSAPGNRAYFGGAGTANQQVIMTMNPPTQLTSAASDTISVLGFTFDGSAIRTIDPVTRAFFVGVGGTVLIGANQPEGLYSATFDVTANYL
jgi:opacity protein-like surface antigen